MRKFIDGQSGIVAQQFQLNVYDAAFCFTVVVWDDSEDCCLRFLIDAFTAIREIIMSEDEWNNLIYYILNILSFCGPGDRSSSHLSAEVFGYKSALHNGSKSSGSPGALHATPVTCKSDTARHQHAPEP